MLLVNGAGMESFLPVITGAFPDLPVVDASAGLPLLTEGDTVEIGEAEGSETANPHLWLDPERAACMAANLAEGLIRLNPGYEERIRTNLASFRERMLALRDTLRGGLQSVSSRRYIIFHEAFPYFADACGLNVLAVVNKEPEDDLSSSQLVRLLDLIHGEDSLPVILKSTETDRSVSVLTAETGLPVCELDPMTTGPENPSPDYYETVMLRNMQVLLSPAD